MIPRKTLFGEKEFRKKRNQEDALKTNITLEKKGWFKKEEAFKYFNEDI